MTAVFDVAAAGNHVAGPTNNSLTVPWSHNSGVPEGVVLAGFSYDTTSPNSRSIQRTVTCGGQPMEPLVQVPKGHWPYVTGAPGYVELWGAVVDAEGSQTISVGLAYDQDTGDPWSEAGATFSNFTGSSVSYGGSNPAFGPASGLSSAGKFISIPISAFGNTITVGVIAASAPVEADVLHQTIRFVDATSQLLIVEAKGSGAFKLQSEGAEWGAATVNLRPRVYLGANQGTGVMW